MDTIENNRENSLQLFRCGIAESNDDVWEVLINMPKWKKKPKSAIELTCRKLGKYKAEFQRELIERAISGNYQGVIFSSTESEYQKWLKNESTKDTKLDRLSRFI